VRAGTGLTVTEAPWTSLTCTALTATGYNTINYTHALTLWGGI
jgi:hypothetical protein